MAESNPGFRDFGILPDDLPPPPETVRCFFSTGRVVGQYIGTAIVSLLGIGFAVLFAFTMSSPLNWLAAAASLMGFGAFVYLATHHDRRWVELEGDTIRAKHLYTGRVIERSVAEIESLGTLVAPVADISTLVVERLLGRIKGIEIRFRDRRTPLRIMRADPAMTNASAFIEAVLYRMSRVAEIEAETILLDGKPLVRNIHWKGEKPSATPSNVWKVLACCLILMAFMAGGVSGIWGSQEQGRREVGSVPPHEISVRSLIENGPGANRHVTLTGFRPGGYASESKSNSKTWTQVWIALFPADARPGEDREIEVVLWSNAVGGVAPLAHLMQSGRVTGICSASLRSSWGTVLGPEIVKANKGLPLSSAWSIEAMREVPSEELVTTLLRSATGSFAAIILCSLGVFWKG
jgi:hypothetical protein